MHWLYFNLDCPYTFVWSNFFHNKDILYIVRYIKFIYKSDKFIYKN